MARAPSLTYALTRLSDRASILTERDHGSSRSWVSSNCSVIRDLPSPLRATLVYSLEVLGEIWIRSFDADTGTVGVVLWSASIDAGELPCIPGPKELGESIAIEINFDSPEFAFPQRVPAVPSILEKLACAGFRSFVSLKIGKMGHHRVGAGIISFEGCPKFKRIHLVHWVQAGIEALSCWSDRAVVERVELADCSGNFTNVVPLLGLERLTELRISHANNVEPPANGRRFATLKRLELLDIASFGPAELWLRNPREFAPELHTIELANLRIRMNQADFEISQDPEIEWVIGDGMRGLHGVDALRRAQAISELVDIALRGEETKFILPPDLGSAIHPSHLQRLLSEESVLEEIDLTSASVIGSSGWSTWLPVTLGTTAGNLHIAFPAIEFRSVNEVDELFNITLADEWPQLHRISLRVSVEATNGSAIRDQVRLFSTLASILDKEIDVPTIEPSALRVGFLWEAGETTATVQVSDKASLELATKLVKLRSPTALNLTKKEEVDVCELVKALPVRSDHLIVAGALSVNEVDSCLSWAGGASTRALDFRGATLCDTGIQHVKRFIVQAENFDRVQIADADYVRIDGVNEVIQQYLGALRWALRSEDAR